MRVSCLSWLLSSVLLNFSRIHLNGSEAIAWHIVSLETNFSCFIAREKYLRISICERAGRCCNGYFHTNPLAIFFSFKIQMNESWLIPLNNKHFNHMHCPQTSLQRFNPSFLYTLYKFQLSVTNRDEWSMNCLNLTEIA